MNVNPRDSFVVRMAAPRQCEEMDGDVTLPGESAVNFNEGTFDPTGAFRRCDIRECEHLQ
jgi:hypothetical protein